MVLLIYSRVPVKGVEGRVLYGVSQKGLVVQSFGSSVVEEWPRTPTSWSGSPRHDLYAIIFEWENSNEIDLAFMLRTIDRRSIASCRSQCSRQSELLDRTNIELSGEKPEGSNGIRWSICRTA
jgi:hypothetical protein